MKKYLFVILILFNFIFNGYAQSYISEINFAGYEFIEIYSDNHLNLSEFILYDEVGINKSNNLNLIKEVEQSNYFLIVSSNFISNNNLSNLNCSIYTNQKSELGYYGLKNSGENISLMSIVSNNRNITINFIKEKELNFNINETLNYDFISSSYFISNQSPCLINSIIKTEITSNTNLTVNLSDFNLIENITFDIENNNLSVNNLSVNNLSVNNLSELNQSFILVQNKSCDYYFEIFTIQDIFTDKIKYKFKTNATNFIIEYFIEDFGGNIVKTKLNSTSLSEKSFTPEFSEIFVIKSNMYINNNLCVLNSSKIVYFYSSNKQNLEENINSNQIKIDGSAHIKILNYDQIVNLNTNVLEYEVYRGNSSKRTIYIYHNREKISSFELEKYSKVNGKINFNFFNGNNSLIISGFDLESKVNFYPSEINFTLNDSIFRLNDVKEKFEIVNFSLSDRQNLYFNINSNFNYDAICHIYLDKTEVSNILNISNFSNDNLNVLNEFFTLKLDFLKLEEKIKKSSNFSEIEDIELKLSCKYKKTELKTYKYHFYIFNYSLNDIFNSSENKSNKLGKLKLNKMLNKTQVESNYTLNADLINFEVLSYLKKQELNSNSLDITQRNFIEDKNEIKNLSYISSNYNMKENSYFGIFIGSLIILISLIIIW